MAFFTIMENFRPNREHLVKMPDELRIQQRLGQISLTNTAQADLTRILSRRAGDQFDAENFVGVITDSVAEYTSLELERRASEHIEYNEEYMNREQEKFLASKMPRFITQLLTEQRDKQEVLWYWFGVMYEKIHADEPVDQLKKNAFIREHVEMELKSDLPRKKKKLQKRLLSHRDSVRPHTTARHNGRH